jgi:hypothetical protein
MQNDPSCFILSKRIISKRFKYEGITALAQLKPRKRRITSISIREVKTQADVQIKMV